MKPVKSFSEFRSELNESRKLNEGILDTIKQTLKKIGDFFSGVGSKFLNALVFQTKGNLPKAVKLYPNQADLAILKKEGTSVTQPKLPESYGFTEEDQKFLTENEEAINEAKIELEHPDPNVENIDTKKMKFLLETQIRAGQKGKEPNPILFWGAPGIGKTAIIEQVAKFHDMTLGNNRLIAVDLQTMRPEDFFLPAAKGGVGKDYEPTTKSVRLPVEWLPLYDVATGKEGDDAANGVDGKGGVIFFDEIARCSPEVQDICLKLCDDSRRVGNFKLGSKWVIVCAANRASDEVDDSKTYNFSSTLGNRFKQYNFVPKFSEWANWAGVAKDEEGDLVVTPEILTFLRFFEDYWHNIDPELTDKYSNKRVIFPTPRAWTKASTELKNQRETAKELGEKFTLDDVRAAVAGSVGGKAAQEFISFLQLSQKIDPKEIAKVYTDPNQAPTLKGLNLGEQKGLMAAVLMQKAKEKLTDQEATNFVKWVIKCDDEQMAMRIMSQLLDFHPDLRQRDLYQVDLRNMLFDHYRNLSKDKKAQL